MSSACGLRITWVVPVRVVRYSGHRQMVLKVTLTFVGDDLAGIFGG